MDDQRAKLRRRWVDFAGRHAVPRRGTNSAIGGASTGGVSSNFSPSARGAVSDTIVGRDVGTTGTTASLPLAGTGVAPVEPSNSDNFATVSYKTATALFLDLPNASPDQNGGNANPTNLTPDKFLISSPNVTNFSVAIADNSGLTQDAVLEVPMPVTSTMAYWSLVSGLTISTDEGSGRGGYGNDFTDALTALSVPELTSLAVLGAGLAGLISFRRRKRSR